MMYDYKCPKCKNIETKLTSLKDRDSQKCENCSTFLKRDTVFSTSFVLKGSGWEKDSYK